MAPALASVPQAATKSPPRPARPTSAKASSFSPARLRLSGELEDLQLRTPSVSDPTRKRSLFGPAPSTKRSNAPSSQRRLKPTSLPYDTKQIRSDRLGTLVSELTARYSQAESWEQFVTDFRGPSYLSAELEDLDHPASSLLAEWRDHGVPVKSESEPWTLEQKDECIRRGCHPSATEHGDFIREEMAEFVENGFWAVLPYELVRDLVHLMFSPAAVKPERERKPRFLCDPSWPWPWGSINATTIPHAPPEAMQFGGTLPRLLSLVRHANPKFGPVRGSKQDLKDSFYKLGLNPTECPQLAALLPKFEGEPQLVAISRMHHGLGPVPSVLLRHVGDGLRRCKPKNSGKSPRRPAPQTVLSRREPRRRSRHPAACSKGA